MHALLVNELGIDPAQLIKVLHYDGTPITERFISEGIRRHLEAADVQSQRKVAAA
jgi:2-oxoglutarate ferredoxin oxidoreductase subunit alpha